MTYIRSFCILLLFQVAGEALSHFLHLPIPGPVIGMALLTVCLLRWQPHPRGALTRSAKTLLSSMGLLFVPAGVGVVANLDLVKTEWLALTVALVGSTFLSGIAAAYIMQRFGHRP